MPAAAAYTAAMHLGLSWLLLLLLAPPLCVVAGMIATAWWSRAVRCSMCKPIHLICHAPMSGHVAVLTGAEGVAWRLYCMADLPAAWQQRSEAAYFSRFMSLTR
jgi:hypothetical protein